MIRETTVNNFPRTASVAGEGETKKGKKTTRNGKVTLPIAPRGRGKCLAEKCITKRTKKEKKSQSCATV